jgi:hypothetical protein
MFLYIILHCYFSFSTNFSIYFTFFSFLIIFFYFLSLTIIFISFLLSIILSISISHYSFTFFSFNIIFYISFSFLIIFYISLPFHSLSSLFTSFPNYYYFICIIMERSVQNHSKFNNIISYNFIYYLFKKINYEKRIKKLLFQQKNHSFKKIK